MTVSTWIVGGSGEVAHRRGSRRAPARDVGAPAARQRLASAAPTSAPSSGTPPVPTIAATVIRTVTGLTDAMAISTGIPAMRIGAPWPRMVTGAIAAATPAAAICFKAERREGRSA